MHPSKDIVLGFYWMTKSVDGEKGEGKYFSSPNTAITAYEYGVVSFRAKIKVLATDSHKYRKFDGGIFDTSVGKLLFNSILPEDFSYIGDEMTQKRISSLVDELIMHYGIDETPSILDRIKSFGFKYSTFSGTTWVLDNVKVPVEKEKIITEGKKLEEKIILEWNEGLLSKMKDIKKLLKFGLLLRKN